MRFRNAWRRVTTVLKRWLSLVTEPYILFPTIAVLVVGVIWGATLYLIGVERVGAERAAATSSLELAQTYEAQVGRALREIDHAMKLIKYAYEQQGARFNLSDLKTRDLLPPDIAFVVSIVDRKGDVVASTRVITSTNVFNQDYFQIQRRKDTLTVGRPVRLPGSGEWKLQFSRRLNATDGTFAGVVVIVVDAAYFVSSYESSQLGEHGVLGILGTDGVFRARRTGELVSAGDTIDYASIVLDTDLSSTEVTLSTNVWDGVRRYTCARRIFDFPLAVVVGLAEDEQLASAHRNIRDYLWIATVGSILLILVVAVLGRMSWQLAQSRLRIGAEQQRRIEELHESKVKLEEMQNQLIQSEKMASVGQLAAGVAHEINNPIGFVNSNLHSLEKYIDQLFSLLAKYEASSSSLMGNAEVLAALNQVREGIDLDFLREDIPTLLKESRDGIGRVKKIVQSLKDFAHVDPSDDWKWSDLGKELDNTISIAWNELKYKCELVRDYGEIPLVECLPSQISQVFLNMLVNASHAIKEKGTITVRTRQSGDSVEIDIADTGRGIDPAHMSKIFDPFFTTKPVGQGTGLGLSISYGIIHKHHGEITVVSERGKGTTFTIRLPVSVAERAAKETT